MGYTARFGHESRFSTRAGGFGKKRKFPLILAFCNDNIVYYIGIRKYTAFLSIGGNGALAASASAGEGAVH